MDPYILALLNLYYQGTIDHDQWIILDAYRKLYKLPLDSYGRGYVAPLYTYK